MPSSSTKKSTDPELQLTGTATRQFHRLCLSTLVAVYFLILVGGIVRSTGSGMGCPDWPTCFGKWVPPTSVSQLPSDYKEQYAAYRDKKNQKFARYLSLVGLDETATRLTQDKSILAESDFNPVKTWVEYLNRLVGVAIGMFIIALFIASWRIRSISTGLFKGSLILLILVIIQGWFGSIVVSTNLTSWTVTVHMFLALVMVALLVWMFVMSGNRSISIERGQRPWLAAMLIAMLTQVFLGTQVRATLDRLAASVERDELASLLGIDFIIHRSFSWVVIALQIGIFVKLRKTSQEKSLYLVPIVLILCSVLTGSAMALFSVPPPLQPVHLLLAVITFGWFFQMYLQTNNQPLAPRIP